MDETAESGFDVSMILDSLELVTGRLETIESHVQRIDAHTVSNIAAQALLIGVVLGVALAMLFRDLWR